MKDRLVGFKYGTMWKNKKQHMEDALGDTEAAAVMMRKLKSRGGQKEELRAKLLSGARGVCVFVVCPLCSQAVQFLERNAWLHAFLSGFWESIK